MPICATAKKLLHEWAYRVLKADINTWYDIFCEERRFDKHVRKCKVCKAHYQEQALLKKVLDIKAV